MTLLELRDVLLQVGIPLGHYETNEKAFPRMTYQELNTFYNNASGQAYRENTRVNIEHFTKTEFDPTLEKLKETLLANKITPTITTLWDETNKVIVNLFDITITRDVRG